VHTSVTVALLSAVYQILNWYKIQLFFRLLQWLCLISSLSQTQFDGPSRSKNASPTCSSLTVNLCYGSPITSRSLGMEFFRILYIFGSD
jgi:hypothetical protein